MAKEKMLVTLIQSQFRALLVMYGVPSPPKINVGTQHLTLALDIQLYVTQHPTL